MADDFDLASDREQIARDKAVELIQKRPAAAEATGFCLECGKPILEEGRRWCDNFCRDNFCRDDWQR